MNDEFVDLASRALEDLVRGLTEVDFDVRLARGHAFAGTDVKRHASPTPVGNFGAQCDKGFGVARRVDALLIPVSGYGVAIHIACCILAADHVLAQCFGGPALEGAQHLELFVTDGVSVGVDGWLHRNRAQQLQRVVLHHVAHRTGAFVKAATLFHTQLFGHGDLDVGDVLAPPQGLEQRVAKSQCKQVLHRGLAQVVVDAKDLLFLEHLAHGCVDRAVGRQVVAQRLFEHDACFGGVQATGGELLTHRGEQARRGGQVHDHAVSLALGQAGLETGVVFGLGQVHAHIAQQGGKAGELFVVGALVTIDLCELGLDVVAVLLVAQVIAAHADDAPTLRQSAVTEGLEQGGHEFAPDQIAGAAKENEIECHVGYWVT